jgi:glycosyltransferase involved in cell wall biosynthesis
LEKKRILVVTSDVAFVEGGHIMIARNTVRALRQQGYDADLVLTPQNRFGRQLRAYAATRFTDVGLDGLDRPIHQVISFRFPSYAVKHPVHVCWLNHRMREYYDLWPLLRAQIRGKAVLKEILRRFLIHRLDRRLLTRNVTKLYAQSATIQARLERWGKIPSEVLYPPAPQREYRTESYQNFVLAVSRLQALKRIDLFIEAMARTKTADLKGIIIGDGQERELLQDLIRARGLEGRVHLLGGADEETLLSHYARCLAVYFAPVNEDYGFVTPEAFASRKAVVTTSDSGGPAELVRDGESGFVRPPEADRIAEAFDTLAGSKALAEKMGKAGHAFVSRLTWPETVKKLVIA